MRLARGAAIGVFGLRASIRASYEPSEAPFAGSPPDRRDGADDQQPSDVAPTHLRRPPEPLLAAA
jgi:hypothetical protein